MHILLGLILFSNALSMISCTDLVHGFCHQQQLITNVCIKCGSGDPDTVEVSTVESENETNETNNLLQCVPPQWICIGSISGTYNSASDLLEISFMFNHTLHADHYLRIIYVRSGSQTYTYMHLKPCSSGFTSNTRFYNDSLISINCQHSSFNFSTSPISLKLEGGNNIGSCIKSSCIGCGELPDGIQCNVTYIPGNVYQCLFDGAILNISMQSIPPEITNAAQQSSTFSKTMAAIPTESTTMTQNHKISSTVSLTTNNSRTPPTSTQPIEESTTAKQIINTSTEASAFPSLEPTLKGSFPTTYSERFSTKESTTAGSRLSTQQSDIDASSKSSSTSRENAEITSKPNCDSTNQTTKSSLDASEFSASSSFYNQTSLVINCQHSSFNKSSSPIRIKQDGKDDFGSCYQTSCHSCKRLPDGLQCIVPYTPGKIYQCILDCAVYNISLSTNPVTETTTTGTTMASKRTTTVLPVFSSSQSITSTSSTEQSFTTALTKSTTERTFQTTESESSVTSPSLTTTPPLRSTTSSNIFLTSISSSPTPPSRFSASQSSIIVTTPLPEMHTSEGSTAISTTQPPYGDIITIINPDVLERGFCHLNGVQIDLRVWCNELSLARIDINILTSDANTTTLLSCVRYNDSGWSFHGNGLITGKHNASKDSLEITLNLNYTVYAGHFLRIVSTCNDSRGTCTKDIHMKACLSGFTADTTSYNDSTIIVKCQHSSFNYSSSPIRIKGEGDNDYGSCTKISCNGCKRIPNGIECNVPYHLDKVLQCILDGAIYNFTKENKTYPGKTTAVPQNQTVTRHTETTPQINSITNSQSTLQERLTTTEYIPSTSKKSIPTTTTPTKIQTTATPTSMPTIKRTSLPTTTSIPTTMLTSISTTALDIPTTATKFPTTTRSTSTTTITTSIPTTTLDIPSTTSIPTTTSILTTALDIPITATKFPTTTRSISTTTITTSIPTTTVGIPSTTTLKKSIPTTRRSIPTTTKARTSTRKTTTTTKRAPTKATTRTPSKTTKADIIYGNKGTSVVPGAIIRLAVFLIIIGICLM